ncbi:hypothetical protein BsWGS_17698 [Bradybaena similaris]
MLNPEDGLPKLHQIYILPPTSSSSVHPPVPLILQNPPTDCSRLPPSFASAGQDCQRLETLAELLDRLDLDSSSSLRKYTKKVLHEMVDACKLGIQGRIREDVQIRLGLLDDQWRDGKLSEAAEIKLGCLASALKYNDLKEADKLHLSLMVDHITEVSQWMVAVKRIVSELKLLHSSPHPATPKKLIKTLAATSSTKSVLLAEKSTTVNGLSIDSSRFFSESVSNILSATQQTGELHKQKHSNKSCHDKCTSDIERSSIKVTSDR